MTTSPTENCVRASRMMATISVPSNEPPVRMTMPTPSPVTTPPKIAARNGSLVTGGTECRTPVHTESMTMAKIVESAKLLPICLYPM